MSRYSVIEVHKISMRNGDVSLRFNNFLSAVMYLIFHLILGDAMQVNMWALVSAAPHKQHASEGWYLIYFKCDATGRMSLQIFVTRQCLPILRIPIERAFHAIELVVELSHLNLVLSFSMYKGSR